jgi:hypothetical protein
MLIPGLDLKVELLLKIGAVVLDAELDSFASDLTISAASSSLYI